MNSEKKERREAQLAKKAEAIKAAASEVKLTDEQHLTVDGRPYELLVNFHSGFDVEKLEERFSDILTKYDYIVGDIGFDQLRLHGFYESGSKKGLPAQSIDRLQDYLNEYCNFGCPYFVLKNLAVTHPKSSSAMDKELYAKESGQKNHAGNKPRGRKRQRRNKPQRNSSQSTNNNYSVHKRRTKNEPRQTTPAEKRTKKRRFVIRQK